MALENGTGSVPGNAQNVPQAHTPRTFSTFPLKAHRFHTERFAEYTPIIAFESVKNDKLPLRLAHNLMSYTMSSPLMQDLTKYKELFSVPMESILPLNWEKFFDNPVRGDDVPVDVGPTIENFWSKVYTMHNAWQTGVIGVLNASGTTGAQFLNAVLRFLVTFEYFYSDGSLMATLGCHGSPNWKLYNSSTNEYYSYDQFFDYVINLILDASADGLTDADFVCDGISYHYGSNRPAGYDVEFVPFRHILCLLRDNPTGYFSSASFKSLSNLITVFKKIFNAVSSGWLWTLNNANIPFNTQFLSAYQLCCAHYFSNDHVDYIYSAELYRQLIGHYFKQAGGSNPYFTRNGIEYQYDWLSAYIISRFLVSVSGVVSNILSVTSGTTVQDVTSRAYLGALSAIFAFRRTLKYMDYFSGARTTPLAVGNGNVSVVGSNVSVIDMTIGIQRQRFRNAVNRVAHSFEGYLKGIFGGELPAPDYHNPFDLTRTADSVFGDQTNNTATEQMQDKIAITTNLRAKSNDYLFEISSDRPCIIIAITYYDIPRVHPFSTDRSYFHIDRFDYFNPFFQYTGDQPVYLQELGIQPFSQHAFANFGYQLKHGEYKQLYSSCAGGFRQFLPGFIFPAVDRRGNSYTLSPEWIRSVNSEFDSFYNSLTGWSNASYFHFIVDNFIDFTGERPMAYSPQILS